MFEYFSFCVESIHKIYRFCVEQQLFVIAVKVRLVEIRANAEVRSMHPVLVFPARNTTNFIE